MKCPHCKQDINPNIIKMQELLDDVEKYPWLLEVPELEHLWTRLARLLNKR